MKKSLIILSILFISLAFVAPIQVSAATSAGVKPGSFFYFFDTTFENIGLFFTFNSESKAKKALEYADERLAEIEAIAEEKNPNAVKTAIANYESNIALATEKSKEIKDKGRAETLFTSIANNSSRNQEILSAVLIKVPEEAKEAIMRAIEASRKGQEEATQQIAELKGEIEQLKKEVAELKAKDETNTKTSEELNNQKSKNISTTTKSQTSPVSETTQTPKSATPAPSQIQTKVSEPQSIPSDTPPQITLPQTITPFPVTQPITIPTPTPILVPTSTPTLLPVITSIILLADPLSIPADGKTTTIISAKAEDKNQNPVPNQTLYFSYGGKTIAQATNSKGEANITYVATTYVGSITIIVNSDGIKNNISITQKLPEGNLIFEKVVEGGAFVQLDITAKNEGFKIKQIVAVVSNLDSNYNLAWNIRDKDWQYLSSGTLSNPWICGEYNLEYPNWEPPHCESGKSFYVDIGPYGQPSGFQLSIPKDTTLRLRDIRVSDERFKIIYIKAVGLTSGKEVILENPSFDSKIIK